MKKTINVVEGTLRAKLDSENSNYSELCRYIETDGGECDEFDAWDCLDDLPLGSKVKVIYEIILPYTCELCGKVVDPNQVDIHAEECPVADSLSAEAEGDYWFEGSGPGDEYYNADSNIQNALHTVSFIGDAPKHSPWTYPYELDDDLKLRWYDKLFIPLIPTNSYLIACLFIVLIILITILVLWRIYG